MNQPADNRETLCVIVPAFNEQDVLSEFHRRLAGVIDDLRFDCEIVYVDDGSQDDTAAILAALNDNDPRITTLTLSRNFGKEIALTAGLDECDADIVVVIDADLQDPPELIPELIARWRDGYDVVYATRTGRQGESMFRRSTAALFYRVMQHLGPVKIPPDSGDFRLLTRRAVEALKLLREHHRFMKGLFTWIGYPQAAIPYERKPRFAGRTKWGYIKLWNLALEGITSFTVAPLKIATYLGLVSAFIAFSYGSIILIKAVFFGSDMPGYSSLMAVILFLGGVQLVAIGIIGEYLGRMFNETKNRPLYFIASQSPSDSRRRRHDSAPTRQ